MPASLTKLCDTSQGAGSLSHVGEPGLSGCSIGILRHISLLLFCKTRVNSLGNSHSTDNWVICLPYLFQSLPPPLGQHCWQCSPGCSTVWALSRVTAFHLYCSLTVPAPLGMLILLLSLCEHPAVMFSCPFVTALGYRRTLAQGPLHKWHGDMLIGISTPPSSHRD